MCRGGGGGIVTVSRLKILLKKRWGLRRRKILRHLALKSSIRRHKRAFCDLRMIGKKLYRGRGDGLKWKMTIGQWIRTIPSLYGGSLKPSMRKALFTKGSRQCISAPDVRQ